MNRIPFGVSELDSLIGGGSPPGSVVLLAGDAGAGAREFLHTSATFNALAHADPDTFELHYGSVADEASLPEEVHYVSFTASPREIREEIFHTVDDELMDAAMPEIEFEDLSREYFQLSPIPRDWYVGKRRTLEVLGAFGDYLTENARGSLVLVDALTDLMALPDEQVDTSEVTMLLQGLKKA